MTRATAPGARRVHITGAPGSGKSTIAARWAAATGLPVHHTDDLARLGGGTGPMRDPAERDALVARILASDAWIVEGVHLGWTDPILAQAELIVRLDTVHAAAASRRIARRFVDDAWRSFRLRTWGERVRAIPGAIGHARGLAGAIVDTRRYARTTASVATGSATTTPGPPIDPHDTLGSRAATDRALAPHSDRVLVCRTSAEVDALVASLGVPVPVAARRAPAPRSGTTGP